MLRAEAQQQLGGRQAEGTLGTYGQVGRQEERGMTSQGWLRCYQRRGQACLAVEAALPPGWPLLSRPGGSPEQCLTADLCPATDLRLQLLDVKNNPYLIKALYGLLMLLPQSSAFQLLSHRLQCVPNPELLQTE